MALGGLAGPAPDRFLVSLGALGLLSDLAGERPLLCLVDDAQWIDQETLQALAFVAAAPKHIPSRSASFSSRTALDEPRGIPSMVVQGLDRAHARRPAGLLWSPGRWTPRVRDRIIVETHVIRGLLDSYTA